MGGNGGGLGYLHILSQLPLKDLALVDIVLLAPGFAFLEEVDLLLEGAGEGWDDEVVEGSHDH